MTGTPHQRDHKTLNLPLFLTLVVAVLAPVLGQVRVENTGNAPDATNGLNGSASSDTLYGRLEPGSPFESSSPLGPIDTRLSGASDIYGGFSAFDISSSLNLNVPSFTNSLSDPSSAASLGLSFDEQDLFSSSPLFGPTNWLPKSLTRPTRISRELLLPPSRMTSGLAATNFNLTPWSGVSDVSLPESQNREMELRSSAVPMLRVDPPFAIQTTPEMPVQTRVESSSRETVAGHGDPFESIDSLMASNPDTLTNPEDPRRASVAKILENGLPPAGESTFYPRGSDVYADMRQSVEWLKRLRRDHKALIERAEMVPSVGESFERALTYVRTTSTNPVTTFMGRQPQATHRFARLAESQLKRGEFYRARSHYRVAQAADPNDPLLHLGEAHALIGAGEYYSAVRKIERAVTLFPEIAYFKLDLNAFVSEPDVLDLRRADLETRLATKEDYRYRFLLGYVEFYSGFESAGLEDLRRAAANAPSNSVVARFPGLLVERDQLLESATSPKPEP